MEIGKLQEAVEGAPAAQQGSSHWEESGTSERGARDNLVRTDALLVSALRRREEAAFAELVACHGAAMQRLAFASLHDRGAVQDVVQEAWLGVLCGIDRFEERCALKTWIFRILQYKIRTRLRLDRRTEPFTTLNEEAGTAERAVSADRFLDARHPSWPFHWKVPPASWSDTPEQAMLSAETRHQLRLGVERLPTLQKIVITLRDVEGWTADEVCDVLDLTPANQRVLLHRARSKVRHALEHYFVIDR